MKKVFSIIAKVFLYTLLGVSVVIALPFALGMIIMMAVCDNIQKGIDAL